MQRNGRSKSAERVVRLNAARVNSFQSFDPTLSTSVLMKNKNLAGGLFNAKPTALTVKESSLSAQIAEWLEARGIYNDRLQCGSFSTTRGNWIKLCKTGTPDRFCIIRGQIVFIEVKKQGEKPGEEQIRRHYELRESGAIVIVCDSFDKFRQEISFIRAALDDKTRELKLYD